MNQTWLEKKGSRDLFFVLWLAMVAMASSPEARADFNPSGWQMVRDITLPEGAAGTDARFAVDAAIWATAAGPALPDLRILSDEGKETGYSVLVPEESQPTFLPPRDVKISKDGPRTIALLDFGPTPPAFNRIHLRTTGNRFKVTALVEVSDDGPSPAIGLRPAGGTAWRPVLAGTGVFSFGQAVTEKFTTLSLPETKAPLVRVTLTPAAEAMPFNLVHVVVFSEAPPAPPTGRMAGLLSARVTWPGIRDSEQQKGGETVTTLDLGPGKLPVRSVTVDPADVAFERSVIVETSDDAARWYAAGSGTIFRSPAPYAAENLTVSFPERFTRYIRLRSPDGGTPPVHFRACTVTGTARYVFFPCQPGKHYRLFYGNPQVSRPPYEYAKTFSDLNHDAAIAAVLGPALDNPAFLSPKSINQAPPPDRRWIWYLSAALAISGIVLLIMRWLGKRRPTSDNTSS
jgi:hypothetical protein